MGPQHYWVALNQKNGQSACTAVTFPNPMPPPLDWIRIRFASRLAAQQVANEILQYIYTLEDPEECEGEARVVIWSTIAFCPNPELYINYPAIQVAERLRLQLPDPEPVAGSQLPSARTLLFGVPAVDLLLH